MKNCKNEALHGFIPVRERNTPEISATVREYVHGRTGAKLLWFDREDKNLTFAISFANPPNDDTGVFHIIEHSVLCGSDKYPLRDPFAELLKGSLNTFLNAMTYEDRTVYPVSSGCKRDFMNLVDVYLDAVFHPCFRSNPAAFRQEGWRYEYDEETNTLSRSGVVYNEMKGAYSSPDEAGLSALTKALFPDSIYRHDSGGDPSAIPELTYEEFLQTWETYYHPSNALIVLDGSVDLGQTLSLIDEKLSCFEKKDITVKYERSADLRAPLTEISYEVTEDSDGEKARLLLGYVFSDALCKEDYLAASILCDYLTGSNSAPLKRALLDAELCRDVGMYVSRSYEQALVIELRDMSADSIERARELVDEVLKSTVSVGMDKERLLATVNNLEFTTRERDYGALPKGVAFALSAFGVWHYGEAPEEALLLNDAIATVKEKISEDYFEKSLARMTFNCPHTAAVAMIPDPTLAKKRAEEERAELEAILDGMSSEQLEQLIREDRELKLWQQTEESEEAKASLPTLSISDIDPHTRKTEKNEYEYLGARVMEAKVDTDGIIYASLLLDASDLELCELPYLGLLSRLLKELPTEKSSAIELQSRIRSRLGSLVFSAAAIERSDEAKPYLRVSSSLLESNKESLTEILIEILTETDFSDGRAIKEICEQEISGFEDDMLSSGHSAALARVSAQVSSAGVAGEYLAGYDAYLALKEAVRADDFTSVGERLSALLGRLVTRGRAILTVSGEKKAELARAIITALPEGDAPVSKRIAPFGARREFIKIPSKVAYAVTGARLPEARAAVGPLRVVRSILSYEHLWHAVRVSGGAYGTGFVTRKNGVLSFYSYRDPSPARSIGCYAESSQYLRELAGQKADITKFIIGAYGEYDVISTPKTLSSVAAADYLTGWTDEREAKLRRSLLETSAEDLLRAADMIDEAVKAGAVCVVGGDEHLKQFEEEFDKIITL